jgi:hypothetical protein
MTMAKPVDIQMPTKIREGLLVVDSTSHAIGPSPMAPMIAFIVPV